MPTRRPWRRTCGGSGGGGRSAGGGPARLEPAWRWARRNPAAAAVVAVVRVLVGLSGGGALWVQRQRAEQRAEAALRAGRAHDAVMALMVQAASLRQQGLWTEARAVLKQA